MGGSSKAGSAKFYARAQLLGEVLKVIKPLAPPVWQGCSYEMHCKADEYRLLKKRLEREREKAYSTAGRLDLERELGRKVSTFREKP